jgi:hypothetical protein
LYLRGKRTPLSPVNVFKSFLCKGSLSKFMSGQSRTRQIELHFTSFYLSSSHFISFQFCLDPSFEIRHKLHDIKEHAFWSLESLRSTYTSALVRRFDKECHIRVSIPKGTVKPDSMLCEIE